MARTEKRPLPASRAKPASARASARYSGPGLTALDPRASRWIGALIRMTAAHPAMGRILDTIERLQDRPYRTNVLLSGEPGTGKEGLARALHQLMDYPGPAVRFDIAGLPEAEALAALCGHGKVAGAAEQADGGVLLIEEVSALPMRVQVALLRLLKSGKCERVGATAKPSAPRLRVGAIALSDRDLPGEVAAGRFRHDLFYRLARIALWLPPLRERIDDLQPSAIWMGNRILREAGLDLEVRTSSDLGRAAPEERARAIELLPTAVEALAMHPWPGNLRELETVIERALLLYRSGNRVGPEEIRLALGRSN